MDIIHILQVQNHGTGPTTCYYQIYFFFACQKCEDITCWTADLDMNIQYVELGGRTASTVHHSKRDEKDMGLPPPLHFSERYFFFYNYRKLSIPVSVTVGWDLRLARYRQKRPKYFLRAMHPSDESLFATTNQYRCTLCSLQPYKYHEKKKEDIWALLALCYIYMHCIHI